MMWPHDVDGDVLRRLADSGLDFDKPVLIDFNVDFEGSSPPEALREISRAFPDAAVTDEGGYALVKIERMLSYELVMSMQAKLSDIAAPFGGRCDSWGVLVKPSAN